MKDLALRFGRYFLAAVVLLIGFAGGSVTDFGQAFQIMVDKDKALAQAAVIINDTPKEEIVQAVKDEGESPSIVEDIKADELPSEPPAAP